MSQSTEPRLAIEEVAALGKLIFRHCQGRQLDDKLRKQLAAAIARLPFVGLRPCAGSLEQDPAQPLTFYLAADIASPTRNRAVLLEFTGSQTRGESRLLRSLVSEQLCTLNGQRVFLRVFPFESADRENIRTFAEQVNRAYLPRPQRSLPAIAAGNRHPEICLPAVFGAYRTILEKTAVNVASTSQLSATREMTTEEALARRDGEDPTAPGHTRVSIRHLYHAGLWAAIRAGWRHGYTAEADHFIVSGSNPEEVSRSVETVKEAIRHAAPYTKFTTDTSRLFELEADLRHPQAWSDSAVEERFRQLFSEEEQRWIRAEFSVPFDLDGLSYRLAPEEVTRLAVKFGQSLKLNEELYDYIRSVKAQSGQATEFDFEPSLDEAETLTTAKELLFYMRWLKARGRPAQLVPPNLGFKKRQGYPVAIQTTEASGMGLADYCRHKMWSELPTRVTAEYDGSPLRELAARVWELAAIARFFDATLSIHSGSGKQAAVLELIGQATGGRVNYKISGELQLQLFDVLAQQPLESPWRQLFERMVVRANRFAAAGAFGAESELAELYRALGRGSYLGDPLQGRVDGNLFLVFWLGNVVGSRDVDAPDGDRRFFKDKLDELPEELLAEVRRRNHDYIVWLAQHILA